MHAHAWDFTDAPLAMRAFLGGQLNEDGIQFRWVAPTELYWDLGTELGRGRAFPASLSESGKNGTGSLNFFTHLGGDIGQSIAWQTGVSHLRTNPRDRRYNRRIRRPPGAAEERLWRQDELYDVIVPLGWNDGPVKKYPSEAAPAARACRRVIRRVMGESLRRTTRVG